jgi:hypothetical protein
VHVTLLDLCMKTSKGSVAFALPLGDSKFSVTYLAQTLSKERHDACEERHDA